jgi:Zn-dependent protease/CBS domain-containing protein
MKRGFKIGTLFGIPFYLEPSWIFIAVLMVITYSFNFAQAGIFGGILLGTLSALLVFGSILAHELGHSLVARRFGVEVTSISLFLLGGMAAFAQESKKPLHSFLIAAAGPLVSISLFFLLQLVAAQFIAPNSILTPLFGLAIGVNFALAAFNLLPGLPLDGGQMVKALVWGITKDFDKGVKVAAALGQVVGWGLVALGGYAVGVSGNFSGLWIALLGWFIQSSARVNVQAQQLNRRLETLTVADSLHLNGSVAANLPFSTYQAEYAKGDPAAQYLVLWQDEVIGIISGSDGADLQPNLWGYYQVRQLMTPLDSQLPSVEMTTPLAQVVEKLNQTPKLLVRGLEGKIVGIVSTESIRRTLIA